MTSVKGTLSFNRKSYSKRKSLKRSQDEAKLKLHQHFSKLCFKDNANIKLEEFFRIRMTSENIKLLKEAFINQKRVLRNASDLTFQSITDLIPDHYKHVNNEMKYVCQMVDSLQEIEFCNKFMGKHLKSAYPIPGDARNSIIQWLSKFQHGFSAKHSTFELSVALFDQCLLKNGLIDQISIFKLAITCTLIAFKMEEVLIPQINVMLDVVHSNVSTAEIVQYELEVLKTIEFGANIFTAGIYLKLFILVGQVSFWHIFEMIFIIIRVD